MKILPLLIAGLLMATACTTYAYTGERVAAADFGVRPNSFENASPALRRAIDYCKGKKNITFVLPGGRIDLWPEGAVQRELYISNSTEDDTLSKRKNIALLLEGLDHFTVEGNHTLIVLHGKMISFAILHSDHITLQDLSFDYERPSISELTIRAVSPKSVEAAVHPNSRYTIDDKGLLTWYGEGWKANAFHTILFDSVQQIMTYNSFKPFLQSKAVELSPYRLRFDSDFSRTAFKPGQVLTVRDPYRDNVGGFIHRSRHIALHNIHMQYMHGLGIVSQFSEDISLVKVKVAPAEGSGRIISAFADCFHFSGCRGSILIDSCYTSGSHDDPINVHGTHLKITALTAVNKMTVRFMHHQTYGFEAFFAGDSIGFVDPATLLPVGQGVVKSARLINNREMELELEASAPVKAKIGDCIENITWTPELTIRNSHFERTNARGILVTTRRKVLIENNTFFRTGMHAILIADDAASWYESGPVQDVTIRNNRFEECGYNSAPGNYIIAIAPENHEAVPGVYVHRNIRIINNYFKVYDAALLTAKSVDGLQFSNNTIERSTLRPGNWTRAALQLTACKGVIARNNKTTSDWQPSIGLQGMDRRQVNTDLLIAGANSTTPKQ